MQPYYPPPQPPQRSGASVGLIIGIVAVVVVLFVLGMFALFGVLAYLRVSRAAAMSRPTPPPTTWAAPAPTATATSALTETYASPNGLVTAHYPSDWAAKSVDTGTLTITRNLSDGTDELVYVAGIENPITNDVNELARVLMVTQTKTIEATGEKWIETSRSHTPCFKSYPGLRVEGTFRAGGTQEKLRMCFVLRKNRAYVTKTMVPEIHETVDLPLLESMVDATDLK